MRPNLPFLSAASYAILNPGVPLKWKKRLVKDVQLALQLTEVKKMARLTSPLLDVRRLSSSRPSLRHGSRLALLSRPNPTLNLCTLYFVLSLALFPIFLLSRGVSFGLRQLLETPLFCLPAKGPA